MSFHEKFGKGTAAEAVKGSFLFLLVLCLRNAELSRWNRLGELSHAWCIFLLHLHRQWDLVLIACLRFRSESM